MIYSRLVDLQVFKNSHFYRCCASSKKLKKMCQKLKAILYTLNVPVHILSKLPIMLGKLPCSAKYYCSLYVHSISRCPE